MIGILDRHHAAAWPAGPGISRACATTSYPHRLARRRRRGADRHPDQEPGRPAETLHRQHRKDVGRGQLPHRGHRPSVRRTRRPSATCTQIGDRHTVMPYSGTFNYALMNNLAVKTHDGRCEIHPVPQQRRRGDRARLDSPPAQPGRPARRRRRRLPAAVWRRPNPARRRPRGLQRRRRPRHSSSTRPTRATRCLRQNGYNCNLTSVRDYSAVTAACMMVRRRGLRCAVGGFRRAVQDRLQRHRPLPAHRRRRLQGPVRRLHRPVSPRKRHPDHQQPRWTIRGRRATPRALGAIFQAGRPILQPFVGAGRSDHTLRTDRGCKARMGARAVMLSGKQPPLAVPLPPTVKPRREPRTTGY